MRLTWGITDDDVRQVKTFLAQQEGDALVLHRIQNNVTAPKQAPCKSRFWQCMIACLLTTQQRSGPGSPISRLISADPFPLAYEACRTCADTGAFVFEKLKSSGGIRRSKRIAAEAKSNLLWLNEHWQELETALAPLITADDPGKEREVAHFLDRHLQGFGPKQSRNLLQSLGLTKYEIPLDSRIGKWLRKFGFPLPISPQPCQIPIYTTSFPMVFSSSASNPIVTPAYWTPRFSPASMAMAGRMPG